jgi:hypothetical protein
MTESQKVLLPEGQEVCTNPNDVLRSLAQPENTEFGGNINLIFQRALSVLSPENQQYRISQTLIGVIKTHLLVPTEENLEFREDLAALLKPVLLVQESTSAQVQSVIIDQAFGVLSSSDRALDLVTFLKKHLARLGYKTEEYPIPDEKNAYEALSKETKLSIEVLLQLEDPAKTDGRIDVKTKNHARIKANNQNTTRMIQNSGDILQTMKEAATITSGSDAEVTARIKTMELPSNLNELLSTCSEEEREIVLFMAIKHLEAGKELVTTESIEKWVEEGNDYLLSAAIAKTTIGKEFAKGPWAAKLLLNKGMDSSLSGVLGAIYGTKACDTLLKDKTFFDKLLAKKMILSLDTAISFARLNEGNKVVTAFVEEHENWKADCERKSKRTQVVFRPIKSDDALDVALSA